MGVLYVPVELTVLFYFFKRSTRACRDLFITAAFSFTTTTPAAVLGDLAAAQPAPTLRGRRRLVPDTDLAEAAATAIAGVTDTAVRDRKLRDGVAPTALLLLSADGRRQCGEEDASAALFFRTRAADALDVFETDRVCCCCCDKGTAGGRRTGVVVVRPPAAARDFCSMESSVACRSRHRRSTSLNDEAGGIVASAAVLGVPLRR